MKTKTFFLIRTAIFNFLYYLTKSVDRNYKSILCFHSISNSNDRYSISKDIFEKEIIKIAKNSKFISLEQALSQEKLSSSSVAITFDDGYRDILTILPILKKHNIKATAFVVSNPQKVSRDELKNENALLSLDEIKQLLEHKIEIGCHSATHNDLTILTKRELEKEILQSKKVLEKKLGVEVKYFAYPRGKYNNNVIQTVKRAGYKAAFSIDSGNISPSSNKWILPRTIIDKTHKLSEFPSVYAPSTMFIRRLTNNFGLWEKFLAI